MEKTPKILNKFAFFGGLAYFVSMLAFFVIKLLASFGFLNFPYADLIFKLIVQIGLMFVLPLALFVIFTKTKPKKALEYFSFKPISAKTTFLSFLFGICAFVIVFFVSNFWSNFLGLFGLVQVSSGSADYSVQSFLIGLVFTAVLPGICEETTHRGMLLFSLKRNGAIRAIVLSGLLFGLMHFNIFQFGYAFVVGMLFGAVTMLTKSIFPAIIMHFTNNALSMVWSYSLHSDWMSNRIVDGIVNFFENANVFVATMVELLVLVCVVWFAYFLFVALFEDSKKTAFYRFKKRFIKQIKNSNLEKEININNDEQIFQIYKNTQILKLQEQFEKNANNPIEIMNISGSKAFEFVLNGKIVPQQKKRSLDNLFVYLSIALGAIGTIALVVVALI